MRKYLRKSRGDGDDTRKQQRRAPGPWWWTKTIISFALMTWRTIIWANTWH